MIKKLLLLLPIILLTACSHVQNAEGEEVRSEYWMTDSERVSHGVGRKENKEVICYIFSSGYQGGISCFPKK